MSKPSLSKRELVPTRNDFIVRRKDTPIPAITLQEKARGLIFSVHSRNVKVFGDIWSSVLDTEQSSIVKAISFKIYDILQEMIYRGQDVSSIVESVVTTIPSFKSYQNNAGDTLLVHAVLMKQYGMVKTLVELGFDPNHINNSGYTPLAYAGMLANKIVYNYLKPLVKNKAPILHHTPVMSFTPPINTSLDLDLAVIQTSHVKAMLQEDVRAADVVIKKAIEYFVKGGAHVNECLKIVGSIISYYDFYLCVGLLVDLQKVCSGTTVNRALHLVLLEEICRCYAVKFHHKEADFYSKKVLALLDTFHNSRLEEAYANLYYNLAISYSESDPIKALEYYEKVKEYIPADDDLHLQKALLLMNIGDSVAALASVDAIVDIKQKQIFNVFFRISQCRNIEEYNALLQRYEYISDTSSIDDECTLYAVVIEFYKLVYLSLFTQIKAIYIKSIDKFGLDQEVPLLSNLLTAFINIGCVDDGIKFLESIGRECFFPDNQKIQFILLVLYLDSNNPDEAQRYLDYFSGCEESIYANTAKAKYQHFLFCSALEEKNYTKCKELIDPSDENLSSILDRFISLETASEVEVEEVRAESQDITLEAALPIIRDMVYITWAIDNKPELLTPQEIHTYFQHKKSQLNEVIKAPGQNLSWSTRKYTYDADSVVQISDKRDLYAVISEKALRKMGDPTICKQFEVALSKGCAKTTVGTNGIKFLDNDIVELKIHGGGRIFASTIIENDTGKHLIVFDRYIGEHSSDHSIRYKFVKSEIISVEHISSEDDIMASSHQAALFADVHLVGEHHEE